MSERPAEFTPRDLDEMVGVARELVRRGIVPAPTGEPAPPLSNAHACVIRLTQIANRLADGLANREPDHQMIGVLVGQIGDAYSALDVAFGLNVDELPLPPIPVTYGTGTIVSSGPRPTLVIEDDQPATPAAEPPMGLRLGTLQEQRLREWPKDRIRPKSVALGVLSLLAEVDALRAERAAFRDLSGRHLDRLHDLEAVDKEHAECSGHLAVLTGQRDAAIARAEAAEQREARLADWTVREGGWRIFHYADLPIPPDTFDLTDHINPDLAPRLRALLADDDAAVTGR